MFFSACGTVESLFGFNFISMMNNSMWKNWKFLTTFWTQKHITPNVIIDLYAIDGFV